VEGLPSDLSAIALSIVEGATVEALGRRRVARGKRQGIRGGVFGVRVSGRNKSSEVRPNTEHRTLNTEH
jgi:hypothetical protein